MRTNTALEHIPTSTVLGSLLYYIVPWTVAGVHCECLVCITGGHKARCRGRSSRNRRSAPQQEQGRGILCWQRHQVGSSVILHYQSVLLYEALDKLCKHTSPQKSWGMYGTSHLYPRQFSGQCLPVQFQQMTPSNQALRFLYRGIGFQNAC